MEPYIATQVGYDIYKSKTEDGDYNDFITQLIDDNPTINNIKNLEVLDVNIDKIPTKIKIQNQIYSIDYEETPEKYIFKLKKI